QDDLEPRRDDQSRHLRAQGRVQAARTGQTEADVFESRLPVHLPQIPLEWRWRGIAATLVPASHATRQQSQSPVGTPATNQYLFRPRAERSSATLWPPQRRIVAERTTSRRRARDPIATLRLRGRTGTNGCN